MKTKQEAMEKIEAHIYFIDVTDFHPQEKLKKTAEACFNLAEKAILPEVIEAIKEAIIHDTDTRRKVIRSVENRLGGGE
jgi:hypothetical protein